MRSFVVVLLLASLAGCSFATARIHNDPRVGCSRSAGAVDLVLSLGAVAGVGVLTAMFTLDPPRENHTDVHGAVGAISGVLAMYALLEGLQAAYGFDVARRCRAERAKLTTTSSSRPADSPATSAP